MNDPAAYVIEDDDSPPFTLEEFMLVNEDLGEEDRRAVRDLPVGGVVTLGGGAAATCTIRRVR